MLGTARVGDGLAQADEAPAVTSVRCGRPAAACATASHEPGFATRAALEGDETNAWRIELGKRCVHDGAVCHRWGVTRARRRCPG